MQRFGAGITCTTVLLYYGKLWQAVALLIADVVVFGAIGSFGYLLVRYRWFRTWLLLVLAANVVAVLLMIRTQHLLWVFVPVLFELWCRSIFDPELQRMASREKIPQEILFDSDVDDQEEESNQR